MKLKFSRRQIKWLVGLIFGLFIVYLWPVIQSKLSGISVVPQPGWYYVREVYDGDTIGVVMNGITEKIRMIGVDTPETHKPNAPVQCYGQHATETSKAKLLNKTVRLESDPTNDNRDRYDRLLRYVYTEDGRLWNSELIKTGEGFAYISFPFVRKVEFLSAQFKAADQKVGLWSACQTTSSGGRWSTNNL